MTREDTQIGSLRPKVTISMQIDEELANRVGAMKKKYKAKGEYFSVSKVLTDALETALSESESEEKDTDTMF